MSEIASFVIITVSDIMRRHDDCMKSKGSDIVNQSRESEGVDKGSWSILHISKCAYGDRYMEIIKAGRKKECERVKAIVTW